MTESCVFCRIIHGEANADILYQHEWVTAFRDLHPLVPAHILIIPKKHVASVNDIQTGDEPAVNRLIPTA